MRVKQDRFTDWHVTPDRRWVLRQLAAGLCRQCPDPAVSGGLCLRHLIASRERRRRLRGSVARRPRAASYWLDARARGTFDTRAYAEFRNAKAKRQAAAVGRRDRRLMRLAGKALIALSRKSVLSWTEQQGHTWRTLCAIARGEWCADDEGFLQKLEQWGRQRNRPPTP